VKKTPTMPCHAMPIYRPVTLKGLSIQSVALACEWACGCPLRWRILHYCYCTGTSDGRPFMLRHYTPYHPLVLALRTLELLLVMALWLPVQWLLPLRSLHAIASNHGTPFVSSSPSRNRGICGYRSTKRSAHISLSAAAARGRSCNIYVC
jgi:hypothetical protein